MAIVRDLIRELAFFILLYGFNLGTDISVLHEAQRSFNAFKSLFESYNHTRHNESKPIAFCSSGPWHTEDYRRDIESFDNVLMVMKVFIALACLLVLSYLATHIWIIHRVIADSDLEEHEIEKYVTAKFVLGLACSMVQDIPLTCLSVDLYVKRSGPQGLICWECYHDKTCADKYILGKRVDHMRILLAMSLTAVVILSP